MSVGAGDNKTLPDAVAQPDLSPGVIARVFTAARVHQGHTLRAVEKGSGVPNAHVSQIERGLIAKPTLDTFAKLAAFYGLGLVESAEICGYGTEPLIVALAAAEARVEAVEAERNEAFDAQGIPRECSLADLIAHHRANAALAVGFDAVAAEARVVALEEALRQACDDLDALNDALRLSVSENALSIQTDANVAHYRAVLASSVKQEKEGLGGSEAARAEVRRTGLGKSCVCGHPKAVHNIFSRICTATVYETSAHGASATPCRCSTFRLASTTDGLGPSPEKGSALSRAQEDQP